MLVLQRALRRRHWLAQRSHHLQSFIQVLALLLNTILEQAFYIFFVVICEGFRGVVRNRILQRLEQISVVDDIAVLFIVTIEPVHAADSLEEAVILHVLIDVEIGRTRCIKAGQEFIDHNKQPHLAGMLDERLLDTLFKLVNPLDSIVGVGLEVVGEHPTVDVVLDDLLVLASARVFLRDLGCVRLIARDDGDLAGEFAAAEDVVELAGLVDARTHQHGVASAIH